MNNARVKAIDLIKKKDLINQRKDKLTDISVGDMGVFSFRIPTLEDISNAEAFRNGEMQDEYLILACCKEPNLRDKELLDAYGVVEPIEIVHKLFMIGEIKMIAVELLKTAGYSEEQVKVISDIKNS